VGAILELTSEEHDLAEVAAFSMAIVKTIGMLASDSGDKRPYLARILETGLHDLDALDCRQVPGERRAVFLAKVKSRYTDLIKSRYAALETTIPAK
jgi:hypothetical protein